MSRESQTKQQPGGDGSVLLCFDGSDNAKRAIETAGRLLGPRRARVLSVWQPAEAITPLDPIGDAVGRLSGLYKGMDEAGAQLAADQAAEGVHIANDAGFDARPLAVKGARAWSEIVRIADEENSVAVVLGARGLDRVSSLVLGSVSTHVLQHCHRPVIIIPDENVVDERARADES